MNFLINCLLHSITTGILLMEYHELHVISNVVSAIISTQSAECTVLLMPIDIEQNSLVFW